MYSMKTQPTQRNMPPLPPATMVIDIRGEGEDVVSMLEVEIKNLTEEMKQQDMRLWSSLADFISFKAIDPIGDDDITTLTSPTPWEDQQNGTTSQTNGTAVGVKARTISLTGSADQLDQTGSFPPQFQAINQDQPEEEQDDPVPPHPSFAGLPEEIDRLRNIRHNAVSNLGRDGSVGRNVKEPGVRIIFLTDARQSNSLFSTAACAAYLKSYYRRLERSKEHSGQQIPINISVLCMNHLNTDQNVAPTRVIQGLRWQERWDHLDALILSERYRQDIGRVDHETQNLLAELLLYVLLIVSPALARIRPTAPRPFESEPENPDEKKISLPPNTFLVGLSSIENSTRWGYRLLNCGLAEQALQILLDGNPSDEQITAASAAESWLNELRGQVRSAVPDRLPGNIPAVQALSTATKAASPVQGVFSNSQLSLTLGKRRVRELEHYLNAMTATYTNTNVADGNSLQQTPAVRSSRSGSYTLQDAVQSIPQIANALDQWNSGEPETPLVQAQLEAHRVLGHPRLFFQGPRGAIPRAKLQLRELATAIASLQGKRLNNPIDVKTKQKKLQDTGQDRIDDLNQHIQKWPFFAGFLHLKIPMVWVTTIFTWFLCFIFVILGFAWIDQFFESVLPNVSFFLSEPLFGIPVFNTLYILLTLTFIVLIIVSIFVFGRSLLKRTTLAVEIIFAIVLLAIAFFSLVTWWSYGFLTSPVGQSLLLWYSPFWRLWASSIALFIVLVMVVVEIFYYSWWRKELDRECESIIEAIRSEHQRNVEDITAYIVDMLALHLLNRAALSDEKAKNSAYYRRIDELSRLLANAYTHVKEERRLAESRLGSNLGEASLLIRQELIDIAALKRGYKRLGAAMVYKRNELKELAEILLRAMGEELPSDIERQFREKAPATNREAYYVQILMETLTAIALRFATAIPASDMLTPLEERDKELDVQTISQLSTLHPLIEALNKKMKTTDLDDEDSGTGAVITKEADVPLASRALAAWGQMLWEQKDQELDFALAPGGVIAKLLRSRYNPQTVKETLGIRTSPSGRSLITGLHDELYLFVTPSPESRKFLRDFLPERYVADFPDSERLLLLHIQHYVAKPMVVQRVLGPSSAQPVVDATLSDDTVGANGSSNSSDSNE